MRPSTALAATLACSSVLALSHDSPLGARSVHADRFARAVRRDAAAGAMLLSTADDTVEDKSTTKKKATSGVSLAEGTAAELAQSYDSTLIFYGSTGWVGACGTYVKQLSSSFALPTALYGDASVKSPLCGKKVTITNTATGATTEAVVADASGQADYAVLPKQAYIALGGDADVGMLAVSFVFADSNTSVPVAASSSSSSDDAVVATTTSAAAKIAALATTTTEAAKTTTAAPTTTAGPDPSVAAARAASEKAAEASAEASASSSAAAAAASKAAADKKAAAEQAAAQAAADKQAAEDKAAAAAASASSAAAAAASSAAAKAKAAAEQAKNTVETSSGGGGQSFSGGVATFYFQNGNPGNCGDYNSDGAIIAALPTSTYDNGAHCGKYIAVTRVSTGQTIKVLVADSCPTCINNSCVDLSEGAYKALGGTVSEGQFPITWKFL